MKAFIWRQRLAQIKGDYTQARNSTIQKMLRMVGFGDNIGSGFRKILTAWKSLGYPAPKIHQEDEINEVWLTLPLTKPDDVNDSVKLDDTLNGTLKLNDTLNDTLKNLSELQRSILNEILKKPSITYSELRDKLHKSRMTIVRATDSLKELGLLIRKGSKKTGLWIVDVNLEEESR